MLNGGSKSETSAIRYVTIQDSKERAGQDRETMERTVRVAVGDPNPDNT
jgi:hypothetical protein